MRARFIIPAFAATAALLLTGCVDNSAPAAEGSGSAASDVTVDAAAVALLPAAIADAGVLVLGTDPTYAPNEFKDEAGNPIGWEIDLGNAIGAKLGLTVEWNAAKFDNIIPNITGGKFDAAFGSFTDTAERQKMVDFVNYYEAGIQWASAIGTDVDPDNACGLKVAVQATTWQDTDELPAKNEACIAAGKAPIEVLKFDTQDAASNAVALGQADAMSADSPVALYAIEQLKDKIQAAGETFDVAPYGIPVDKGSELTAALQAAIEALIADGTYMAILDQWGVGSGAVSEVTINIGS